MSLHPAGSARPARRPPLARPEERLLRRQNPLPERLRVPGHAHVLRAEGPQEVFEVEAATLQLFFSHGLEVLFREDGQGLAVHADLVNLH